MSQKPGWYVRMCFLFFMGCAVKKRVRSHSKLGATATVQMFGWVGITCGFLLPRDQQTFTHQRSVGNCDALRIHGMICNTPCIIAGVESAGSASIPNTTIILT